MIRDFLIDYKDGLFDSLQGFLVLHKLNQPSHSNAPAPLPVREHRKMTVLEKRRAEVKANNVETWTSNGIRRKPSALYRVLQCAAINICAILILKLLGWLMEWFASTKYPTFYAIINSFQFVVVSLIILIIRVLSTLWFADVASAALAYKGDRSSHTPVDISRAASDFVHAIIVELIFLGQTMFIWTLPFQFIAPLAGFIYMSLLNSLYSFEYMWMSRGIPMAKRIALVERRWPFHLGFGTILTAATSYSNDFMINGCIFGALFPFFIVSSYLATTRETPSEVPAVSFFYFAQVITNKISLFIVSILGRNQRRA